MKKLLLTSVAALLLATGTVQQSAQAEVKAERDFICDPLPLGGHFTEEKTTKDAKLTFEVGFSDNRERNLHSDELVIRYNFRTDKLWINGKQCKWDK